MRHMREPVVVHAVVLLLDRDTPLDGGRFCRCKEACRIPDLFLGDPGDLFHLFQGVFVDSTDELLPPVGVVLDKILVVELLVDDHVEHPVSEGRVRAGSQREPDVGPRGRTGEPRIDDDELGAMVQGDREGFPLVFIRVDDRHVVSPKDDALGEILVIDDRIGAAGDNARRYPGSVTEVARRQDVGRAKAIGNAVDHGFVFPASAVTENDGFRPVLLFVPEDPLRNGVQGLVPGDPFPFAARLGADPSYRIGQSVRMIGQLGRSEAFAAESAVVDGTIRVAGDLGHLSVFDINDDAAPAVAHATMTLGTES